MVNYGAKELAAAFRTVRKNTVQVAEDIPEDKYDFVAAPDVKPVRQMLAHIAWGPTLQLDLHRDRRLTTLQGYDWGKLMGGANAWEAEPRTKAELVALLKSEGEAFARWLDTLSDEFLNETYLDPTGANPKTRFESIMGVKEHEMHHRAQLMLILRLVGGVPHITRQRQAQAAATAARK
jgi:uncharacterized damage-inducible protein DinB